MATILDGTGTFTLAAHDAACKLKKTEMGRPKPGPNDVLIEVKYCGMCHSDLHACNGDWGMNMYPLAPGHEISGIATFVGENVNRFKVGDRVGVGCMVESCRSCDLCTTGLENHCPAMIQTYGANFPAGKGANFEKCAGTYTNGGYSTDIVVDHHFVFQIPDDMKLEYAGILLCAGITTFSPLNRHILEKGGGNGKKVGVVGFGGLGHMAVKLAKAMGCEVTVISRSTAKADAAKALGADIMAHTDEEAVKAATRTFDVVLDTISKPHPVAPLVNITKVGGVYVLLGGIPQTFEISPFQMLFSRQVIEGSLIGGVPETQKMLDFCAEHKIIPEYKIIHAREASDHFQSLDAGTSLAERAVIDIATLRDL